MGCHLRHGPGRGDGLAADTDRAGGQTRTGRPTNTDRAGRRTRTRRPNAVRAGVARSAVSGAQDLDDVVGSEAALGQQDKGVKQEIGRLAGQGDAGDGSIGA